MIVCVAAHSTTLPFRVRGARRALPPASRGRDDKGGPFSPFVSENSSRSFCVVVAEGHDTGERTDPIQPGHAEHPGKPFALVVGSGAHPPSPLGVRLVHPCQLRRLCPHRRQTPGRRPGHARQRHHNHQQTCPASSQPCALPRAFLRTPQARCPDAGPRIPAPEWRSLGLPDRRSRPGARSFFPLHAGRCRQPARLCRRHLSPTSFLMTPAS